MAVAKEELDGSPTLTWSRKGGTAVQKFRIAWNDINAFVREVFPSAYVSGSYIIIPKAASFPGKYWLIADNVSIEPFDPNYPQGLFDIPNYYPTGARVTVNYKTPEFDQQNNSADGPGGQSITFVKHKVTIGGEFLTYPSPACSWDAPSDYTLSTSPGDANRPTPRDYALAEDMQVAVTIPLIEHQLTWPHVAFPPWLAIRQCVGKVNAYPFAGAPAETLLFLGADGDREITNEGIRCWSLDYKLSEKNQNAINPANPQGWNHFLRPDGPSAGQFMRMRKRIPGGSTTVTQAAVTGATSIKVKNATGFPRGGKFEILIGTNYYTVLTTGGSNTWTLDATTPLVADVAADTAVTQQFRTTLSAAMNKTTTQLKVDNRSPFPRSGQFLVQVGNEIMAVVSGHGEGAGTFYVLRAVQGTAVEAHGSGDTCEAKPGNIYDLADFRVLFLSGLITG